MKKDISFDLIKDFKGTLWTAVCQWIRQLWWNGHISRDTLLKLTQEEINNLNRLNKKGIKLVINYWQNPRLKWLHWSFLPNSLRINQFFTNSSKKIEEWEHFSTHLWGQYYPNLKPDKDITRKENYRLISLMNMDSSPQQMLANQIHQHTKMTMYHDQVGLIQQWKVGLT